MAGRKGFEPSRLTAKAFMALASTDFATPRCKNVIGW